MKSKVYNLLIVSSTLGCYGGMEAFVIALAEAASHWPEYNVKLCFKLTKGAKQQNELVKAAESVCPQLFFVDSCSKQLLKLIAWSDVLHVQNTPPDAIFFARLLGKRVFLTVHNWRKPSFDVHSILWGISIRFAHRRWFNSQFVWNTWEPVKKSFRSDSFPTVSMLPSMWCPPEDRKGFIFIGRWIDNKGIEEILKAYAINNFDPVKWPLTLLGDGPLKPVVQNLVKELGLDHVNMPGFVDMNSKEKLLSSARWLLAPAKTNEDLGLTPIEARSVGVPSIVTRDGGLPEAGGEAALIAEPGNVEDLARCMLIASNMGEDEYRHRGDLAKKSLEGFLRPLNFYRKAYLN